MGTRLSFILFLCPLALFSQSDTLKPLSLYKEVVVWNFYAVDEGDTTMAQAFTKEVKSLLKEFPDYTDRLQLKAANIIQQQHIYEAMDISSDHESDLERIGVGYIMFGRVERKGVRDSISLYFDKLKNRDGALSHVGFYASPSDTSAVNIKALLKPSVYKLLNVQIQRIEDKAWNIAVEGNTEGDYERYLKECISPTCLHREDARKIIKDEQVWRKTLAKKNQRSKAKSMCNYLEQEDCIRHRDFARSSLDDIILIQKGKKTKEWIAAGVFGASGIVIGANGLIKENEAWEQYRRYRDITDPGDPIYKTLSREALYKEATIKHAHAQQPITVGTGLVIYGLVMATNRLLWDKTLERVYQQSRNLSSSKPALTYWSLSVKGNSLSWRLTF